MTSNEAIYCARWLFPIDTPPIEYAMVRVADRRIIEMDTAERFGMNRDNHRVIDLGDQAILPKLINAHTHLEFSDCSQPIGTPGVHLAKWIGLVIAARGEVNPAQRDANIAKGLKESLECGVGWIGDIATPPTSYPLSLHDGGDNEISILSFAEVLGLSKQRGEERLKSAESHRARLGSHPNVDFGVSPHAPYSTPVELIQAAVQDANRNRAPVAIHLAESPDERVLLESGGGPFADSLKHAGLWQPNLFPHRSKQPIENILSLLAAARRALVIHGNDLQPNEIDLLSGLDQLSVVYCPRTHRFFEYEPHPVSKLLKHGIRVALGTDSRASNPDLSIWGEVQYLLNHRQDLSPESVLTMATANGADALLGPGNNVGRIQVGSPFPSGVVLVPTSGNRLSQVYRDFAEHKCRCIKPMDHA